MLCLGVAREEHYGAELSATCGRREQALEEHADRQWVNQHRFSCRRAEAEPRTAPDRQGAARHVAVAALRPMPCAEHGNHGRTARGRGAEVQHQGLSTGFRQVHAVWGTRRSTTTPLRGTPTRWARGRAERSVSGIIRRTGRPSSTSHWTDCHGEGRRGPPDPRRRPLPTRVRFLQVTAAIMLWGRSSAGEWVRRHAGNPWGGEPCFVGILSR